MEKKKGFTLIELLVTIAVAAIIAAFVVRGLGSYLERSRDQARKQGLAQIQQALTLYFNDFGGYPSTSGNWYSSEPGDNNPDNGGNYIPSLAPTYIGKLPSDPKGGPSTIPICASGWKRSYHYRSNSRDYKLLAHCSPEAAKLGDTKDPFYDPIRPNHAWQISTDGANNW